MGICLSYALSRLLAGRLLPARQDLAQNIQFAPGRAALMEKTIVCLVIKQHNEVTAFMMEALGSDGFGENVAAVRPF